MQRNTILHGDAWALAKTLPDESINCIVTSPPYFGLRDYGTAQWEGGNPECDHKTGNQVNQTKDSGTTRANVYSNGVRPGSDNSFCGKCGARRVDSQFGLEATPEEFVDKLVDLFRELRRALRHDGTCWINLGSSYAGSGGAGGDYNEDGIKEGQPRFNGTGRTSGYKNKDLVPIPWLAAIALRADGWYLRRDIIWAKGISFCPAYSGSSMPESVSDRPTSSHEYVFLLTKSPNYYYDNDAIREPHAQPERGNGKRESSTPHAWDNLEMGSTWVPETREYNPAGRNVRSVWAINPRGFKEAHFATFPEALVRPMILAGCPAEVCAACGNPVVRVVEHGESVRMGGNAGVSIGHADGPMSRNGNGQWDEGHMPKVRSRTTTGFSATCTCDAGTVPGITLDPFMGSGTTAVVAKNLGRDYVGFELNESYIKLAEQRIGETQPPLFVE